MAEWVVTQLTTALLRWGDAADRRLVSPALLQLYRSQTPGTVAGRRVLFLCEGNVCRSPLAAAHTRRLLGSETGWVDSAGLGCTAGRPPPELALKVAAAMGLDLGHHRSLPVSVDHVRKADYVFVMDRLNVLRAWRRFPEARRKLFLLDAPQEVPDPYGQPEQAFWKVFEQIRGATERLLARCRR
jgi:protein-tyrosine phosphatase